MCMNLLRKLGYVNNGKVKSVKLSNRQISNLIMIVERYKEELCGSNQDIENCQELLDILNDVTE